jgi:ubiquinone/menaquinone biosynthesis C-methylase UbiE
MYDFVAAVVSLGRWRDWINSTMPYLVGPRVLEIGHGPGHLQVALYGKGVIPFGLDESKEMGVIAHRHIISMDRKPNITRGLAQSLPFSTKSFSQVVATFPSEYIFESRTLSEAYRVLVPGGRFIVLPLVWITGEGIIERFTSWLFRVTGQTGPWDPKMVVPFKAVGFQAQVKTNVQPAWTTHLIIAEKPVVKA